MTCYSQQKKIIKIGPPYHLQVQSEVLPVSVSVCVCVPANVVVLRCVQRSLQLSAQSQAVCVFGRVRVVEKQNHQQEKHVNQEIL